MEQIGNTTNSGIEQAGNMSDKSVKQGAIDMVKKTIITKLAVAIIGVVIVGAIIAGISISKKNQKNQSETIMNQNHVEVTETGTDGTETTDVQETPAEDDASGKKDVYILPESNIRYIKSNEINKFNAEKLNLAKNEIYARHGFIFNTDSIKKYFENCAWYEPSVASSEFSDSVFNEYEVANIALLETYEKISRYTYPLKIKDGESVKVDLNGDGELDKISLNVKRKKHIEKRYDDTEFERYEYKTTLTINDCEKKYETDSLPRVFITDINDDDNKKEISVETLDANDIINYNFYQYSGDRSIKDAGYLCGYGIQYLNNGRVLCTGRTIGSVTMLFVNFEYIYKETGDFEYVNKIYDSESDFDDMNMNLILTLKKEIEIYKDCAKSSGKFKIKPQKLRVTGVYLPKQEDYQNVWTRVELEDKSTGWIYGNYGGDYENETFDGLHFAG